MRLQIKTSIIAAMAVGATVALANDWNTSYINPIMPGWHSDPSCVHVPTLNNTTFCTTSSFLEFPGASVYASKDLVNWRLASNAFNRPEQLPSSTVANIGRDQELGVLASTLRYHEGKFYIITTWLYELGIELRMFIGTDPYDETTWGDAIKIPNIGAGIDPDLFWDDNGDMIVIVGANVNPAVKEKYAQAWTIELNANQTLATNTTAVLPLWTGSGGIDVEGPHIYRKDGYYYILLAEDGTRLAHSVTMARAKSLQGPWEAHPANPVLTNRDTNEYYQTVGHADLFEDSAGNWWAVAHATRGGPDLYRAGISPLARETVLTPVQWSEGDWPTFAPVRGYMSGPIPTATLDVKGQGSFIDVDESEDFLPGSALPRDWDFVRAPVNPGDFVVSPPGRYNQFELTASRSNITGSPTINATTGITLITRLQTATLFDFSFDMAQDFSDVEGDEAGMTSFKYNDQHVDLGLVNLPGDSSNSTRKYLQARATGTFAPSANPDVTANVTLPETVLWPIPAAWSNDLLRLRLHSINESTFEFSAAPAARPLESQSILKFSAALVTGSGIDSGHLVGAYATTNGADREMKAYISRWRYNAIAQQIDYNTVCTYNADGLKHCATRA